MLRKEIADNTEYSTMRSLSGKCVERQNTIK